MINGLALMIIGMISVFAFLEILIFFVRAMSYIIKKYSIGENEIKVESSLENNEDIATVIAVISDFIKSEENYNG